MRYLPLALLMFVTPAFAQNEVMKEAPSVEFLRAEAEKKRQAEQLQSKPPENVSPPTDLPAEIREMTEKAEKGVVDSQYSLAVLYAEGAQGVERNYEEAAKWHLRAAESGHAESQYYMGFAFEKAVGVKQDNPKAMTWYEYAAEQGHPLAQGSLGLMYESGAGGAADDTKAYFWLLLAHKSGEKQFDAKRLELEKRIRGRELIAIQRSAAEWKPTPGKKPKAKTEFDLGD